MGVLTKSYVNKRFRFGMNLDIADRSSGKVFNNPNFRDDQDKSLKGYTQRYLKMHVKKSSTSLSPIAAKKSMKTYIMFDR